MRVPCSCGILGFSAAIAASFTAAPKTMETLTLISPHIRKSIRSTAVVNPHPTSTTQARFISYFKQGKKNTAGHNSAGRITSFHRGGGAKRVFRKIDYKRTTSSVGIVERIEYDPNRSSRIALVRWIEGEMFRRQKKPPSPPPLLPPPTAQKLLESSTASVSSTFAFSSLPGSVDGRVCASDDGASSCLLDSLPRIAVAGAKPAFFTARKEEPNGKETFSLSEIQKWGPQSASWAHRLKRKAALSWRNLGQREGDAEYKVSKPNGDQGKVIPSQVISYAFRRSIDRPIEASGLGIVLAKPKPTSEEYSNKLERAPVSYISASHQLEVGNRVVNYDGSKGSKKQESLDLNFQVGNCMPLADIRLGTWVHDIELHPGQGAKLTRAAGTFAKVVKEPSDQCLVRLPSGREKLIDSRCRATIGVVSNPTHGARKLRKAGHSRWLGRRPVVRGIAMNPVDHPHGGGEGRTKGGRPSVSPWGKPTKAGFKTAAKFKRDRK